MPEADAEQIGDLEPDHRVDGESLRVLDLLAAPERPEEDREHDHAEQAETSAVRHTRCADRIGARGSRGAPLHDAGLGRVEGEREPQRHAGDHVDPENLRRRHRQSDAEEGRATIAIAWPPLVGSVQPSTLTRLS